MPPTQTQAISYTNIPRGLQLQYGLCISLVIQRKLCQNQTASNYYGEICFCCSSFNFLINRTLTHINPSHLLKSICSDILLALGLSIRLVVVHKNHVN